jgi:hypothetical protein
MTSNASARRIFLDSLDVADSRQDFHQVSDIELRGERPEQWVVDGRPEPQSEVRRCDPTLVFQRFHR